jgi:hypothetical protein
MTTLWRTFLTLALGGTLSFPTFAADSGAIKGLWDFIVTEQPLQIAVPGPPPTIISVISVPGLGSQGASTLTSDEDFAPNEPGNEVIAFAARNVCMNVTGGFNWTFKEQRKFFSTDGEELATFEIPTISLNGIDGLCINDRTAPLTNRSSSAFAEDRGTRVYVYTRAFYPPSFPPSGVWYIGVFDLDGTLLWDKAFRPYPNPPDPDDLLWNIVPSRSAVGPLLSHGKSKDVIRIYRTRFFPSPERVLVNRYTYLDLLTGDVIKDVTYTVREPDL